MSRERPTILQVIPELDAGGAERSTVEIAAAIVQAGGKAIVVSEGGRLGREIESAGARLVTLPVASKNPLRILANARALERMASEEGVDLLHARSRAPAWSALIAARRTGRFFVTTYHGAYNERGPLKKLYNSVMARADRVIANSAYTARLIRARYGTKDERIAIIPRGVDLEDFDRQRISPERLDVLRARWDIPPGTRVILHPARLTRWKGQTTVVEALAHLRAERNQAAFKLVFAGDAQGRDDYVANLERRVTEFDLSQHVVFAGHVDDMPAAYALARVTLVASIEAEAFGRTAVEAAALGSPVIATRIGAPQETVLAPPAVSTQEATGWLVPPDDPLALAEALATVLNMTSEDYDAMAARAIAHARRAYSARRMQETTLAVYDALIGSRLADTFMAGS